MRYRSEVGCDKGSEPSPVVGRLPGLVHCLDSFATRREVYGTCGPRFGKGNEHCGAYIRVSLTRVLQIEVLTVQVFHERSDIRRRDTRESRIDCPVAQPCTINCPARHDPTDCATTLNGG